MSTSEILHLLLRWHLDVWTISPRDSGEGRSGCCGDAPRVPGCCWSSLVQVGGLLPTLQPSLTSAFPFTMDLAELCSVLHLAVTVLAIPLSRELWKGDVVARVCLRLWGKKKLLAPAQFTTLQMLLKQHPRECLLLCSQSPSF